MSTKHVSIRLDEATLARVDALASEFSTEWRGATRSDILRALIQRALELYERREGLWPLVPEGSGEARPGRKRGD